MIGKPESCRMEGKLRIGALYTVFYQEWEPGFVFAGESHPMAELTYVEKGTLHAVADGQDFLLNQGELILFSPDQWHMYYADMGESPRFMTVHFDLPGETLWALSNRKLTASPQAVTLLQQILREHQRMDAYAPDMMISLLQMLLLSLLREQRDSGDDSLRTVRSLHSENRIIRQAQQYISTHVREQLTVPKVAAHVDVSPSYLTALFHKNLQIAPGEYIRRVKLQESKQMIRENNLNFTEIAAELQYSTVHHFSRQFKEKFGMTPTEYAKSVR